jgi:hypothetical protein
MKSNRRETLSLLAGAAPVVLGMLSDRGTGKLGRVTAELK